MGRMAFRFINQLPQFLNAAGQVLSGGQLAFYQSGTTTPQDTFTDDTLSKANPNPLELDSTGRPTADIWMNGNYRVVLLDNTGATIWTRDNVEQPGGTTFSLPALVAGQFLTNNGSAPSWAPISQVPSPAGAAGQVLGTDGTNLFWQPAPSNGTNGAPGTNANITVTPSSFKANNGSGAFWFVQGGSSSAPATGTKNTQQAITFPTAFASTPFVIVMPSSPVSGGIFPIPMNYAVSTTGFTVYLGCNDDNGTATFTGPTNFSWIAFGTVAT